MNTTRPYKLGHDEHYRGVQTGAQLTLQGRTNWGIINTKGAHKLGHNKHYTGVQTGAQ